MHFKMYKIIVGNSPNILPFVFHSRFYIIENSINCLSFFIFALYLIPMNYLDIFSVFPKNENYVLLLNINMKMRNICNAY